MYKCIHSFPSFQTPSINFCSYIYCRWIAHFEMDLVHFILTVACLSCVSIRLLLSSSPRLVDLSHTTTKRRWKGQVGSESKNTSRLHRQGCHEAIICHRLDVTSYQQSIKSHNVSSYNYKLQNKVHTLSNENVIVDWHISRLGDGFGYDRVRIDAW